MTPARGPLHPGAWLAWASCASLVAISTTNPFYLLPLFASCTLVYATNRRRDAAGASFRLFLLVGAVALVTRTLLVVFGSVSSQTIVAAFLEGLRLAVVLSVYGVLNAVTDPYRFLRLAPRRFHEPALAATLALSIAPRTVGAVNRVKEAQRLRGIEVRRWRSLPALAVPVLETGMEEAVTLAESMDARGHGRGGRSRYRPQRWTRREWAVAVAGAAVLAAFVFAARVGPGSLTASTSPLRWPDASGWLVAAVCVLGAPAVATKGGRE